MKTRSGLVSNSSSSSFVLDKEHLSPFQVGLIRDHIKVAGDILATAVSEDLDQLPPNFGYVEDSEAWSVEDDGGKLLLRTDMDNFSMSSFLDHIGVPQRAIREQYY